MRDGALERSLPEEAVQEGTDGGPQPRPQRFAIGLEHRPLGAAVDALLDEECQPPDRDILPFAAGLIAADDIFVVATPDLACLRNAKNLVELLRASRPNDTPPRLVINQVGVAKRPEIPAKDFAETIGLEPALVMPFEPALFGQAANNGQMLIEIQPKAAGSEAVRRIARSLTGRTASSGNDKQSASLFSFLKTKKQA